MRGPGVPWLDEDETVYSMVLRRTADTLAERLEVQAARLRDDSVTTDEVFEAIKKQMAACAVDDPLLTADLAELMLELIYAKEHSARAV
jgi:hypothetical protein